MRRFWSAMTICMTMIGCGGGSDDPAVAATLPVDAQAECASLRSTQISATEIGLPTRGAGVTSAEIVASSPKNAVGEYCLVRGQIESVDVTAEPILFSIALPSFWNGRAVQLGGGGWNGFIPDPAGTASFSAAPPPPLAKGYAVFGDNSGHTGGDASFALNSEQLRNYGGDHLKKARDVAMSLIRARYRTAPAKTYFAGQSNGGREALMAMQRWGQDYDGVLAIFPALAWTPGFMKMQQIGVAMRANGGAGWISQAKASTLRAAVLQSCDALDGLSDGIVANYDACSFDPRTLRCSGGVDAADTCLSDAQLATVSVMETPLDLPYALANNVRRAPAFNRNADWSGLIGADLPLGNTAAFNVPASGGTPPRSEIGWNHWFADGFLRYALLQDAHANTLAFDPLNPGGWLGRLQDLSAILDATNPAIQPFLGRGGKLILIHGQSDQLIATQPTIDYYKAVVDAVGQAQVDRSVRFYLVPGYAHFGGLSFNATQGLSAFAALEDWVEDDISPAMLTATDVSPGANGRTRPLCLYPAWPKYRGSGDVDSAASFSCATE